MVEEAAWVNYISSRLLFAEQIAEAVRARWRIENALHWVLDVTFRDDLARVRKATARGTWPSSDLTNLEGAQYQDDERLRKLRRCSPSEK
jgi:hypothetical protein